MRPPVYVMEHPFGRRYYVARTIFVSPPLCTPWYNALSPDVDQMAEPATWELWNRNAAAQGSSFTRTAGSHRRGAPPRTAARRGRGGELQCRRTARHGRRTDADGGPTDSTAGPRREADPRGGVGILPGWWNAPDGQEWVLSGPGTDRLSTHLIVCRSHHRALSNLAHRICHAIRVHRGGRRLIEPLIVLALHPPQRRVPPVWR